MVLALKSKIKERGVEPPPKAEENCRGWACVGGVPAWKPTEATVGRSSLNYLGKPNMMEMQESWDIGQGKLQTKGGVSSREKCAAANKAERSCRSKQHLDVRHGDAEFRAFPGRFWSLFGPVFPPLRDTYIYPVLLYVGSMRSAFLFLFCRGCYDSQRRFWTLNNVETVRDCGEF